MTLGATNAAKVTNPPSITCRREIEDTCSSLSFTARNLAHPALIAQ